MLVPEVLTAVAVFALLDDGCREVWMVNGHGVFGFEPQDDQQSVDCFKSVYAEQLGRRFGYFGTAGDRNVHVMTGRIH